MTWEVRQADCIEAMREMDEASVDAICTDPPYGLEFMGKEWDRFAPQVTTARVQRSSGGNTKREPGSPGGRHAKAGTAGVRSTFKCRSCGGWSGTFSDARRKRQRPCECEQPDFDYAGAPPALLAFQAWSTEWATEALRVLKPGGHLLAFGGTRTYHRLACAVEDAGFEIRDSVIWLYGSGFPKSLAVDKAIDRAAGAEREVVGTNPHEAVRGAQKPVPDQSQGVGYRYGEDFDLTAPATPEAQRWQGWGTALKPAWENVVCAVKPDPEGEWTKIHGSLCELRAKLLSLSPAKPADESSESRPVEPDDPDLLASAGWTAGERSSSRDALCEAMGTSQFESALASSLSIASSWSDTLDALWKAESTSTTETASSTTTDLRTLSSCLSGLTPRDMLKAATSPDGSTFAALPAAVAFNAVASTLNGTLTLSALARATSQGQESSQAEDASQSSIVVARKPLIGTVAETVSEFGTGALNIDGCRIEGAAPDCTGQGFRTGKYGGQIGRGETTLDGEPWTSASAGRWPANVALSHLPECERVGERRVKGNPPPRFEGEAADRAWFGQGESKPLEYGLETVEAWRCVEGCSIRELDRQSGDLARDAWHPNQRNHASEFWGESGGTSKAGYGDTGGASRFFATFSDADVGGDDPGAVDRRSDRGHTADVSARFRYTAKASRAERNAGLEGFEEEPRHTTMSGAHINRPEYESSDGVRRSGIRQPARNNHPTVKPVELMRWLCRLVVPPGGVCLDPFTGSGTTGIACVLEGFDFVGIEREADYCRIAESRIAWWDTHKDRAEEILALSSKSERERAEHEAAGQTNLFGETSEAERRTVYGFRTTEMITPCPKHGEPGIAGKTFYRCGCPYEYRKVA